MGLPKQRLNVPKRTLGTSQIHLDILKLVGAKNTLLSTVAAQVTIQDVQLSLSQILKKWDILFVTKSFSSSMEAAPSFY